MAETLKQVVECACGCGRERTSVDRKGRTRLYLIGHFARGRGAGPTRKLCVLPGCQQIDIPRKGMCHKHYQRWKKYGNTSEVRTTTRHGHAGKARGRTTGEYSSWQGMRARCNNPNVKDYPEYGGRGIAVCQRWNKFENFLADMGRKPTPQHSIDRFPDNNGNYDPDNCRWATPTQQNRNSRHNRMVTIGDVSRPLVEWSEALKVRPDTLLRRIASGRDPATGVRHAA